MKFAKMLALLLAALLAGCASVKRLPPPDHYATLAGIPGIPDVRVWGDNGTIVDQNGLRLLRQRMAEDPDFDPQAPIHFLAISGGGQKGAFGAGLLSGWTDSGTRPEFRMVTGISTGSLLAPFAFLGPEYDRAIQEMYTRFSTKDVLKHRFFSGLFTGDSMADNAPLRNIVETYFTPVEMEKVAREYGRGRWLLVGTTYLDVQRPVIWNIGAIASSGHPDAYDLIIDVLLASSAIPGVFPPVYFKVERDGQTFDELHVDGGVTTQVFISPVSFDMEDALKRAGFEGEAHVYLIRNAKVSPEIEHLKPKTVPILTQSLATLLRAQGLGDMYRIYQNAQINNMAYHVAYLPDHFRDEPDDLFNIEYMSALFQLAYTQAQNGYPWESKLPEFKQVGGLGKEETGILER
ncbi:patatin-like phospholipase family protein [Pontiella sp.]|uniref:patatin-like phospholipase family protein n=1 Tax=Pontiella sp. TaxID=2837462 RepID=UPI0035667A0E